LWQLARGQTATQIAETTGFSRYWIGQIARRYNQQGPAGIVNRSPTHSHWAPLLLLPEQLAELATVIRGLAPEGDLWIGRTVAAWISSKLGRPVSVQLGWAYLVRPASGRTVCYLATSVSIALFETELEAFAAEVSAGNHKEIVLVLDRAGWHDSLRLRVPEHVRLLFLPPLYNKLDVGTGQDAAEQGSVA
jgi:hypothetical protein